MDTIKNVGPQRITLGEIGMIKSLIWIADHAKTLHQPPTAGIGWIRDGHDVGIARHRPERLAITLGPRGRRISRSVSIMQSRQAPISRAA